MSVTCPCGSPLPEIAIRERDAFCSTVCARAASGLPSAIVNANKATVVGASVGLGRYANRRGRYRIRRDGRAAA